MDWDEFVRRGDERRARRDFPPKPDAFTLVLGAVLFALAIFWLVWGLTA